MILIIGPEPSRKLLGLSDERLVPRGLPLACDVLHFGVVIGLDNWLVGFFILIQKKQVFSLKKPFSRVAKTSGND